jgi:hypothetical protein
MALWSWLESTSVAATIGQSILLTGGLSAVHLLGFTVVTGGGLITNLTLLGILFPDRPPGEIVAPASRGMAIGLLVSVTTGVLLLAPRASAATANSIFQVKMLLLGAAATFHWTVHRSVSVRASVSPFTRRLTGGTGLVLWVGLALAGCAFILLE